VLRTRFFTALVALPAVLAIIVLAPGPAFTAFVVALAAFGLYEIGAMNHAHGPALIAALAIAGGGPVIILLSAPRVLWTLPAAVIAAMLAVIARVATVGPQHEESEAALTTLGALYVGLLFPYFALLRNSSQGIQLVVLILLLVVASDTGAYFAGIYLGRIKLAPKVSPNKTVEGATGGLGLCVAASWILRPWLLPNWSYAEMTFAAFAIGILAQLGDLACSAYKRVAGVKDSGWLFPGHGGLLDRTSSLVFAVVFAYYYSR
jgi:phosphatidate cytidylyltransferase